MTTTILIAVAAIVSIVAVVALVVWVRAIVLHVNRHAIQRYRWNARIALMDARYHC